MNIGGAILVAEVIEAVFQKPLKVRYQVARFPDRTQHTRRYYVALLVELLSYVEMAVFELFDNTLVNPELYPSDRIYFRTV